MDGQSEHPDGIKAVIAICRDMLSLTPINSANACNRAPA